ncbi:hypothetical protein GCM10027091_53670 [Streptomyces daliensis]
MLLAILRLLQSGKGSLFAVAFALRPEGDAAVASLRWIAGAAASARLLTDGITRTGARPTPQ